MRNITFSPILLSVLVQLPIKKKPLLQYHSTLSHAHASLAVA